MPTSSAVSSLVNYLTTLPHNVLTRILSFAVQLDCEETKKKETLARGVNLLMCCELVSKTLKRAARDNITWQTLLIRCSKKLPRGVQCAPVYAEKRLQVHVRRALRAIRREERCGEQIFPSHDWSCDRGDGRNPSCATHCSSDGSDRNSGPFELQQLCAFLCELLEASGSAAMWRAAPHEMLPDSEARLIIGLPNNRARNRSA